MRKVAKKRISCGRLDRYPLDQFQEDGLLQEVNRLFFHPRNLVMGLEVDGGDVPTGHIYFYKEPKGIQFNWGGMEIEAIRKAEHVASLVKRETQKTPLVRHWLCTAHVGSGHYATIGVDSVNRPKAHTFANLDKKSKIGAHVPSGNYGEVEIIKVREEIK